MAVMSMVAGAGWQFFDNNGDPLVGGKLYSYLSGTTIPQPTFTNEGGLTSNTNPIILDSAGRVPSEVWLSNSTLYKITLTDATDVEIWTKDTIPGVPTSTALTNQIATSTATAINTLKAQLLDATLVTQGDAMIGFHQSNSSGNIADAESTTVHKKLQEIVSVKDFGAVGDGLTDDRLAFSEALNYASNRTHTGVYVPAGSYLISSDIAPDGIGDLDISLFGDGPSSQIRIQDGASFIQYATKVANISLSDFNLIPLADVSGQAKFAFFQGVDNLSISNVNVIPEGGSSVFGSGLLQITAGTSTNVLIDNCVVVSDSYAVRLSGANGVKIHGCKFTGTFPTGIISDSQGIDLVELNNDICISDCTINEYNHGIRSKDDGAGSNSYIRVSNLSIDRCGTGIEVTDGPQMEITTSIITYSNVANISFDPATNAGNMDLTGGQLSFAGQVAGNPGVGLYIGEFGFVNVTGTSFYTNRFRGIDVDSISRSAPAIFTGCLFAGNGEYGIGDSTQAAITNQVGFYANQFYTGSVPNALVDVSGSANFNGNIHSNGNFKGLASVVRPDTIPTGASGDTVQNTTGQRAIGYLFGTNVSDVEINGATVYSFGGNRANATIILNPLDTYSAVYSSTFSIVWYFD